MLDIIFTILGLLIGISVLVFLDIAYKKGPERLSPIILQLLLGMSVMILGFAWDMMFIFKITNEFNLPNLHHFLFAASMLFFANAARKLYQILK